MFSIDKPRVAVFHPSLLSRGGSQRYAIETALILERRGFQADLLTSKYLPSACYPELLLRKNVHALDVFEKVPINRSSFRSKHLFLYYLLLLTGLYALARFYRDWQYNKKVVAFILDIERTNSFCYDIVYLHEASPYNGLAKYFKKLRRRVFLFCYDTPDKVLGWESEGLKFLYLHKLLMKVASKFDLKTVQNCIEKVLVLDSTMEQKTINYYDVRPSIIHGGIDLDVFRPSNSDFLKKRFRLNPNNLIVTDVTRLVPYRRVHDIFKAFSMLDESTQSRIYIYINAIDEDTDYTYELKSKYADYLYPAGNIIIDHVLSANDTELAGIYQSSDAFIFPNENQTWGNAVLEAMACGACVFVSDSCGISEIIEHGQNGFKYRCKDIEAIKNFLVGLVDGSVKYAATGVLAAEHVSKNLSWNSWGDAHVALFKENKIVEIN